MKTFKRIQELITESIELIIPRGTISMPRNLMPQIEFDYYPEFINHLASRNIAIIKIKYRAKDLLTAQTEIDKDKVLKWMKFLPKGAKEKPLIISADRYIVDGNHSWISQLNNNPDTWITCYQIGLDFLELLNIIKLEFKKIKYKDVKESKDIEPFRDSFDSPFQILRPYK
jgi:hypothetical protein